MRTQKQTPSLLKIYRDVHAKLFPLLHDRTLVYEDKWSLKHEVIDDDKSARLRRIYLKDIKLPACRNLIRLMPIRPQIFGGFWCAEYRPYADQILMPSPDNFVTEEDYYATLFHELIHSTGHPTRLGRFDLSGRLFRYDRFHAMEELIAEIGAAYLSRLVGIFDQTVANKAAYITGYLQEFCAKRSTLHFAVFQAQRAVEYILRP